MSAASSGLAMEAAVIAVGSAPSGWEIRATSRCASAPWSVQMPWVVTPDARRLETWRGQRVVA